MEDKKDAIKTLHEQGLKATPLRVELLSALQTMESAVSSTQLYRQFANSERVTLYRTINTLIDKEVIHKTQTNDGEVYYALSSNWDTQTKSVCQRHVHFKCNQCQEVTCQYLPSDLHIEISDFKIEQINILLNGVCDKCCIETDKIQHQIS